MVISLDIRYFDLHVQCIHHDYFLSLDDIIVDIKNLLEYAHLLLL